MSNVPAIEVEQLRDMLNSAKPPFLVDVRAKWENDLCQIPTHELIPLEDLSHRLGDLPKDQTIVVHCHHGGRSARAVAFLLSEGYLNVFNLKGGIHAWAERIDPNVKTYG